MKVGNCFFLHRDQLGPDHDPYMKRFKIIDTPLFAIRVHRILRSDADRHLHDHPWSFVSFVLRGGYLEYAPHGCGIPGCCQRREVIAPWVVFHRAADLHRLRLSRPALTLVFCGPRRREWGFQTESGWVPWRDYLDGATDV